MREKNCAESPRWTVATAYCALVRNLYSFHQQEIFLTILNEDTDWTRLVQHPTSILEDTADARSDALIVAPVVEAGTLHPAAGLARKQQTAAGRGQQDTKLKLRDHYHAHRLSVWTQLITKLHRAGGGDVPRSHHLLEDFHDEASYDGVLPEVAPPPSAMSPSPTPFLPHYTIDSNSGGGGERAGKGAEVRAMRRFRLMEAVAASRHPVTLAKRRPWPCPKAAVLRNWVSPSLLASHPQRAHLRRVYYQRDKADRACKEEAVRCAGVLKRPSPASPCTGGCEHQDYQSTPAVVTGCLTFAPPTVLVHL
ncbi:hypothetical protein HPB52_011841 [Rhipicephalus sanguineus]|uniref:Uncharacterized protein n=1 Tax=Rhipicephalus sanguineus TaxID=34632 RepID=A0A9D4Q0J5_RHISA|nr:hypothetical protein HPB52_011841 [Rhipicephalus sanguineus]